MKMPRCLALAAVALASASLSYAQAPKCGFQVPAVSRVEAQPFQLKQTRTIRSGAIQQNVYTGQTVLTITPAQGAPSRLNVNVELMTVSNINTVGDGLTDGVVSMRDTASKQMIAGPLIAVNQCYGDLTGIVEGRLCGAAAPTRLRAVFHGVFTQDANGNYTLVNVDSHGVLTQPAAGATTK